MRQVAIITVAFSRSFCYGGATSTEQRLLDCDYPPYKEKRTSQSSLATFNPFTKQPG